MSWVDGQFELEDHLQMHLDHARYSPNSHLYCTDLYCDYLELIGVDITHAATRVGNHFRQKCIDMCLCDDDCVFFVWGDFTECTGSTGQGTNSENKFSRYLDFFDLKEKFRKKKDIITNSLPGSGHGCSMCRIFHTYDTSNPFDGFTADGSSTFGAKNRTLISSGDFLSACENTALCENPFLYPGSNAIENVDDSDCDAVVFGITQKGKSLLIYILQERKPTRKEPIVGDNV